MAPSSHQSVWSPISIASLFMCPSNTQLSNWGSKIWGEGNIVKILKGIPHQCTQVKDSPLTFPYQTQKYTRDFSGEKETQINVRKGKKE